MRREAKLNVFVISVKKAKEFKVKSKQNYSKKAKLKRNNVRNVIGELRNWMRKAGFVGNV